MSKIRVELKEPLENGLSCLEISNADVDFYRDCVSNQSKMIISKVFKNNVELYYHIPINNIVNLYIGNLDK